MLHGYRVPEKSVYKASQCSTCTVTYQIHSGHIRTIPFCTAMDDNERLQKVAELSEQVRFRNWGVFRNKGQISLFCTPCPKICVQSTASCNEIAAVDVDDNGEFLAIPFLVFRNKRRDGQALITSFRDDVMRNLCLAANSDCSYIGFRLILNDFL